MIVVLDKMLRDAGLDFNTASALLAPGQDELVIHVAQLLDDAPQPPADAISSLVIAPDTEPMAPPEQPPDIALPAGTARLKPGGAGGHGGDSLRQTAPGETSISDAVPTIKPPNGGGPLLPMDIKPHRLERGASWGEIQATAAAMRITATLCAGSGVALLDAFGSTIHPDMASAVAALNARWAHFNAIGTRG